MNSHPSLLFPFYYRSVYSRINIIIIAHHNRPNFTNMESRQETLQNLYQQQKNIQITEYRVSHVKLLKLIGNYFEMFFTYIHLLWLIIFWFIYLTFFKIVHHHHSSNNQFFFENYTKLYLIFHLKYYLGEGNLPWAHLVFFF